jgi:DNA-binding MarR family transcriptional regulator
MTRAGKTPSAKNSGTRSLTTKARAVVETCTARSVRNVARRVIQLYDEHLEPHGFSLPQFSLLMLIAGARDDTLAAIAEAAGLDPSTLTRNLQGLEKLGLVEIAAVEADQRKRSVWLTETGARRVEAAIPAWEAAQAAVEEKLGAGFHALVRKAEKAL